MTADASTEHASTVESTQLSFRRVMGHYPTGVCVVTAIDPVTGPVGMTVGSFTSVSLDPPLIAFLPRKGSATFEAIRRANTFCVNVLAADQEDLCRAFAIPAADRFNVYGWHPAPSGSPVFDETIAWIDCAIERVDDAGDHLIVLGRAEHLEVNRNAVPLVFARGGYGKVTGSSLTVGAERDLTAQLRVTDLARPEVEAAAKQLGLECLVTAVVGDQLVQLAACGAGRNLPLFTKVGLRLPFVPPMGAVHVAWDSDDVIQAWVNRSGVAQDAQTARHYRTGLDHIRHQGWAATPADGPFREVEQLVDRLAMADTDGSIPAQLHRLVREVGPSFESPVQMVDGGRVHAVDVPVFDPGGRVILSLTASGLADSPAEQVRAAVDRLLAAAFVVQGKLGTINLQTAAAAGGPPA